MTARAVNTVILRIVCLALVTSAGACKEREKQQVRPTSKAPTSDASADGWRVKMSNDLLQQWILACGGASAPPTADGGVYTIFLGDEAKTMSCTVRYTQANMELHDIQLSTVDADPKKADARFIEFVDDILLPLLPTGIADRVRADAVNRETYVSKRVGPFTIAMRTESDGTQTTRWVWVFRGDEAPAPPREIPQGT